MGHPPRMMGIPLGAGGLAESRRPWIECHRMNANRIREIEVRLATMEAERAVLSEELGRLRAVETSVSPRELPKSAVEKADLFLKLFRARESVYPRLWENPRTGRKGYAPACCNEWVHGLCEKPKIKCSECRHQSFPPLDQEAVLDHLRGQQTIGTYAIREDNTCVFLAADFDGDGWQEDVLAYKRTAATMGVPVLVERSRSGQGAHAWIFFSEAVPAVLARRLGTLIVSKAASCRPSMSLSTYDRFFPNQDLLPQGGFGNLIALPLQRKPREKGHTLFLDDDLAPFPDPWSQLASVRRLSREELQALVPSVSPDLGSPSPDREEQFSVSCDEKALDLIPGAVQPGLMTGEIQMRRNAQLEVPTSGLPAPLIAGLKRLATFANPKFYELQRLRFPTYKTPRFIFCGEIHPDRLVLPRGVLDGVRKLVEKAGAKVVVKDLRPSGEPTAFEFQGVLTRAQREAVKACAAHEEGVLMAPAGAGKTVMGCALIAQRQTRTLVLTHRRPLLEQWKSQLICFLGLKKRGVRVLSGKGGFRPGPLDLGMFQTLVRMENAAEVLSHYRHVVIDECHHVPAVSFEAVLKACSARYILGLTATPTRKDGLQKILFMQCGPVRHEMKDRGDARIERKVLVRRVSFKLVHDSERPPIHLVWEAMVNDGERTDQIINDVAEAVAKGRRSLVLSDRKQHLLSLQGKLASKLSGADVAIFMLESGTGQKERKRILEEARQRFSNGQGCVLLATSSLIGEGFDLPQLDTLFLAMPLSFKGRLIQYAGRLHRSFEGKRDVVIYDYIEPANALTMSMHRKRLIAYRQMGYRVETPSGASEQWLFHSGAAAP